jgi:DNA ligase 1
MNSAGYQGELRATATVSNVKRFPRLFRKTNTGAIQYWDIFAEEKAGGLNVSTNAPPVVGEIVTVYGQLGTPSPQRTTDTVASGKNEGKANATTAFQQAQKEAKSKWEKQKKKGYVETEYDARAQNVDSDFVGGGLLPMLAQSFSKHAKKIKWPCYVQPKLDGMRCIAIVRNGKATLWSRTRKPILSVPHIVAALEENFGDQNVTLDGELYSHKLKSDFERIMSLARKDEPAPGHEQIQYHIYDMVSDLPFNDRNDALVNLFGPVAGVGTASCPLIPVLTGLVGDEEGMTALFSQVRGEGYEGLMLRNGDSKYEQGKRSYGLQKVKEFEDAEFDIIGVEEGRGRLQGHVGSFVCRTKDGKEFLAKMSGETAKLKAFFEDESLWSNKRLTVQFQGLTGAKGVPRFPVGLRIREEE